MGSIYARLQVKMEVLVMKFTANATATVYMDVVQYTTSASNNDSYWHSI